MSLFNTYDFQSGRGTGHSYIIGRVKKVVLGANYTDTEVNLDYEYERDLGKIFFEPLYSNKSGVTGDGSYSKPAYPMFSFIRQYPLIGEIVLIFPGATADLNDSIQNQDLWYISAFSVWNSVHQNVFPNLQEYADFVQTVASPQTSTTQTPTMPPVPQGFTFEEKDDGIKSLRPFEGDTIFQGRFGQSIRLGSTVPELKNTNFWSSGKDSKSGDPITIFVNSQRRFTSIEKQSPVTVEDINRDGTSIYMTSTQTINITALNSFPRRSYSANSSFDPQVQQVIKVELAPKTNDFKSAQDQDNLA